MVWVEVTIRVLLTAREDTAGLRCRDNLHRHVLNLALVLFIAVECLKVQM
jgi:hypothetical protein